MNTLLCNKHNTELQFFCSDCKAIICSLCKSSHITHVTYDYRKNFDKILQESKKFISSDLSQTIQENREERKENDLVFKDIVENHYTQECQNIDNYFRGLVDEIHNKQVELNRELKSYHNENTELMDLVNVKLDSQLEQYQSFINSINTNSNYNQLSELEMFNFVKNFRDCYIQVKKNIEYTRNNNNNNNNNNNENLYKSENHKLFNEFTNRLNKNDIQGEFSLLSLKKASCDADLIEKTIPLLSLQKINPYSTASYGGYSIIYRYSVKGVERIDLKTNETTLVIAGKSENEPEPSESYFHHDTAYNGIIYIFSESEFYILDTNLPDPSWHRGHANLLFTQLSTCYDDNNNIYIQGGFQKHNHHIDLIPSVHRFNTNTHTFQIIGKSQSSCRFVNPIYHNGKIHLVGGFDVDLISINCIDEFNLTTNKIENTFNSTNFAYSLVNVRAGVYDRNNNCYYLLIENTNLVRVSNTTRNHVVLANPVGISLTYYVKMYFDGEDKIYFIVRDRTNIPVYNISTNSWSSIADVFSSAIGYCDFVAFSNK